MRSFVSALLLNVLVSHATASDTWPQFRGGGGDGHSNATGLPLRWSEAENVTWKIPVAGRAWSSPVVCGEQIWMTTAIERAASPDEAKTRLEGNRIAYSLEVDGSVTLRTIAVDRSTGKQLFDVQLFDVEDPDPIQVAQQLRLADARDRAGANLLRFRHQRHGVPGHRDR